MREWDGDGGVVGVVGWVELRGGAGITVPFVGVHSKAVLHAWVVVMRGSVVLRVVEVGRL